LSNASILYKYLYFLEKKRKKPKTRVYRDTCKPYFINSVHIGYISMVITIKYYEKKQRGLNVCVYIYFKIGRLHHRAHVVFL